MAKLPLVGGFYRTQSVVAGAQRCLGLYPERNRQDAPFPYTLYLTPGLTQLANSTNNIVRGAYTDSNGVLWVAIGNALYWVSSSFTLNIVGFLTSSAGPVSMKDNRLVLLVGDGSANGWAVDINAKTFALISGGGNFFGFDVVDFLDTFFIMNRPGTNVWYISLSETSFENMTGGPALAGTISSAGTGYTNGNYTGVAAIGGSGDSATFNITVAGNVVTQAQIGVQGEDYRLGDVLTATIPGGSGFTFTLTSVGSSAFDPLDFVALTGSNNGIGGLKVVNRQIWVIGDNDYGEIWYNVGAPDFTFGRMPGVAIQHGCPAIHSVAQWDLMLFWLGRDDAGNQQVYQGWNYQAKIISPPAVAQAISGYTTVKDAIGYCYQQKGHVFYVLTFPTADATWVYDITESEWHERAWTDSQGIDHRHRSSCQAFAYGMNVVGDWQTGQLYALDPSNQTDNGAPIRRERGFPHIVNDGKRISVIRFIADMDVGQSTGTIVVGDLPGRPSSGTIIGGSDYLDGTYYGVSLIGGFGVGALATITVVGGIVTNVAVLVGSNYQIGDVLTVDDDTDLGGTGFDFSYTVTGLTLDSQSDFAYRLPQISLGISKTKGASYQNPRTKSLGATGQYDTNIQFLQIGMGRDFVFKLFWDTPAFTALNGAYIEAVPAGT